MKSDATWFLLVVVILLYIGLFYKTLGQGWNVFLSGQLSEFKDIDDLMGDGQGYINIIWQSLCVWLYVCLIMNEKRKYDKVNSIKNVIVSLCYTYIFVLITFIENNDITRWYTFVSAFSALFLLIYLFNNHTKRIILLLLIPLASLMMLSTIIKNGGYVSGDSVSSSIEGAFGSTSLDAYCNGLGNVNVVYKMTENNSDISFLNLPFDALTSMPIINHYLPKDMLSTIAFHKAIDRTDQIIPMIGQSYLYFGFILSPILTIISILFFRFLDFKFYIDYTYKKYVYSFFAIWFSIVPIALNLSIFFMWLYIRIIPFYIIMWLTNKKQLLNRNKRF